MNRKPIIIMLSYARSGGTLLNRCIASMPGVIMLSEINVEVLCPSSCNTIKDQVKKWYGIILKSEGFVENIKELYNHCLQTGQILVIRDWTFGSFVPSRYNNFNPSKSLATFNMVSKYFPVRSFVLVRDSIDIWLSFNASPRTFYDKNLEYLYEFIVSIINCDIKIFYYEDFCKNPVKTMNAICNYTGMKYSSRFKNFSNYFNVTGDIDTPEHSRGAKNSNISLLPRRKISSDLFNKINNTRALDINELLGY
jgi:hypothetical protein